jgi:hypothetical protein
MIKALCTDGSVILGLSFNDLERLKRGEPIFIDLGDMGLPKREIYIFAGPTEDGMLDGLLRASGTLPAQVVVHPLTDDPQKKRT